MSLGSEKSAQEFDELPSEESKKRLRVLAKRMDRDKVREMGNAQSFWGNLGRICYVGGTD